MTIFFARVEEGERKRAAELLGLYKTAKTLSSYRIRQRYSVNLVSQERHNGIIEESKVHTTSVKKYLKKQYNKNKIYSF